MQGIARIAPSGRVSLITIIIVGLVAGVISSALGTSGQNRGSGVIHSVSANWQDPGVAVPLSPCVETAGFVNALGEAGDALTDPEKYQEMAETLSGAPGPAGNVYSLAAAAIAYSIGDIDSARANLLGVFNPLGSMGRILSGGVGEGSSALGAAARSSARAGGNAPRAAPRTNFNQYETLFEAPITGTTRGAHRTSANNFLSQQLDASPDLQRMFNQELGTDVLQHMNSGAGRNLLNPPGTVWHHPVDNPSVMQLLRTGEHTNPLLQPTLHPGPNGTGGFGTFFGTP